MFRRFDFTLFVDRLAQNVHDSAKSAVAHGDFNAVAGGFHRETSRKTFCRLKRYTPDGIFARMEQHFQHDVFVNPLDYEFFMNFGDMFFKPDVDNRPYNLAYFADKFFFLHICPLLVSAG